MLPEAKALSWSPKRRIHGLPRAVMGASTSSPAKERPFAVSATGSVGNMRTPASR